MNKKLYRSRRVRVLGGVAGGLADYFGLDSILVRIIFVIITFATGLGILLYIILWIVVPEEPFELAYPPNPEGGKNSSGGEFSTEQFQTQPGKSKGRVVAGIILISIGVIFFAERFIPSFEFCDIFPLVLVLIGIALIWNSIKK
ncbi:MAG: PspC domain-containing protein [Ignavibacteriales bacterium]|nr:PspC domain-containing protein [Ignavibacteriales bacterium]